MTDHARILVVDDDQPTREMLLVALRDAGLSPTGVGDGPSCLRAVREERPDLVLLDVHLPLGITGRDVLRKLREDPATADLPIIVLTGMPDDERLELTLLEEGADDYIRKTSFKPRVLAERIRAVLRRAGTRSSQTISGPHLAIHPGRREVLVDGKPVNLTPTEFDILRRLATHPDRVLTRRELLERGEGEEEGDDRTVDVHVLSIRRKLGRFAWLVSTVWGRGYRLGSAPGS